MNAMAVPGIFHEQIDLMKDMLQRGEMIYLGDRKNPGYVKFKQETMRVHYAFIESFWGGLEKAELVEKCACGANGRRWSDCPLCGGAGFKTKEDLNGKGLAEDAR